MLKVGINGFGRIGRAILRNILSFDDIDLCVINDINPEPENLAYLLKYDSYYGRLKNKISINKNELSIDKKRVKIFNKENIKDVPWMDYSCDLVIESSGKHSLLDELPILIEKGVKKVIVTYSPNDKVDGHFVLGANEENFNKNTHHIISSSICDVVALAPVYKIINENFNVINGFLTTLHPWLSYQNLLDGPPQSWGYPGSLYGHYSLGRAATASLIIKPTTAISASEKIFSGISNKMKCYSYRVPTPVVGAADITFQVEKNVKMKQLIDLFLSAIDIQKWPILHLNDDPLVSVDFTGTNYSAIVDKRWVEIVNDNLIKITLWYDNEYAYSRRVVDLSRHIFDFEPKMNLDESNSLS